MDNLYDGIDEVAQEKCVTAFNTLADEFNNGDLLVKNFVANNIFNFLISIITDDMVRQKILDAYEFLN